MPKFCGFKSIRALFVAHDEGIDVGRLVENAFLRADASNSLVQNSRPNRCAR